MEHQRICQDGSDESDPRRRVLALLRRYGSATTSFQVLEPGFSYWFVRDDACVAYADTGGAWIAAGPPIAAPDEVGTIARAFLAEARKEKRRACFFAVNKKFADDADLDAFAIGEDPEWDLATWSETLRGARSLREQLRRARAKGIQIRVLDASEVAPGQATRVAIEALVLTWLDSRPMATMGFLVDVKPFGFSEERLYLVAEKHGLLVGFLSAIPVYARAGFFVEDLLRTREAPNGTAELLVDHAFRELDRRGLRMATLGLAPLAGPVARPLVHLRRLAKPLYHFEGVRAFKSRLKPARWVTQYLAFPHGTHSIWAIRDTLSAFATGGFLRFGLATLSKQRRLVVLVLGSLLVPWTLLLATGSGRAPWFPSAEIRIAWILFDGLLSVALISLFWRWRPWLVSVLACVAGIDAILTGVQIVYWNLPHAHGWFAWPTLFIAQAAPVVATAFLVYARRLDTKPKATAYPAGMTHKRESLEQDAP